MTKNQKTIDSYIENSEEATKLFGVKDQYLHVIEQLLDVSVVSRGAEIYVTGEEQNIQTADQLFALLLKQIRMGQEIHERDIMYIIRMLRIGKPFDMDQLFSCVILRNTQGRLIRPKTFGQRNYVEAIKQYDLVFGIGPAGTGKTYLAVVMAVAALKNHEVKKIILTRPAVEAGESLGFLPGDLKEKVDPYLRPLYDALHDVLGQEQTERLVEKGVIEIAPLAYMRGRTLENAFVILDEAQNTTLSQIKMFLTRLGFQSKMIVNGDRSQVDLPKGTKSGLEVAIEILQNVKGSKFIFLDQMDVVRNPLVARIINAFEKADRSK